MASFKTTNSDQPRLSWHPRVHQDLYFETCYYFLLRLKRPTSRTLAGIREILESSSIRASCVYFVYGYYDVLLRFWATGQKRSRFLRHLKDFENEMERCEEFQAQNVEYLWWKNEATGPLVPLRAKIEEFANRCMTPDSPEEKEAKQFEQLGLLQLTEATDSSAIKFYMVVSKGGNRSDYGAIKESLREFLKALRETNIGFRCPSLYSGLGFATHLIKAVATSYADIIAITSRVSDFLEKHDWRVMTLLVANKDVEESDQLDHADDVSTELQQLEVVLGPEFSPLVVGLSAEDRRALADVFGHHAELLDTPFQRVLLALFQWKLTGKPIPLVMELAFILAMEGLLANALRELWIKHLGAKEWFQVVKSHAPSAGIVADKNPMKDYTMHDYIAVSDKLRAAGVLPAGSLDELLGANWKSVLDDLRPIRNDFAHGRMFDPAYKMPDWQTLAHTLCRAGRIFNRLKPPESDTI